MKLNLSFFQPTTKNTVTTVTSVIPADDAGCIGNQNKNAPVTTVTNNETVTAVTEAKKARLPIEPANNAEVTAVTGVTAKNTIPVNILQATDPETAAKMQAAGAIQDGPARPEHVSGETNATEATPAQQAENSAEALINKAVELEYYAKQQGAKFAAYELGRLLAAVDIVRDRGALETACRELAAFIDIDHTRPGSSKTHENRSIKHEIDPKTAKVC